MSKAAILAPEFSDPDKAREFLEEMRWPEGPVCPHCGLVGEAYKLTPKAESKKGTHVRKGVWKCSGCRKEFTVTVGTIFEGSHIALNTWLFAYHLLCASKKGMSAHQLHRMLGVTYRSAWFMAHRIRYTMSQEPLSSKLTGVIELDETYVGGKRKLGPHVSRHIPRPARPHPFTGKEVVVSVLQRGGRIQSHHLREKVTSENLRPIIEQMVDEQAHLMTDTSTVLRSAGADRKHDKVNHTIGEYARYQDGVCISTNSVEGYFANLKRGINGVYHHVGRQHLHRYLSEFDFRFNARKIDDKTRARLALKGVDGKRLKLRDSKEKF